MRKIIVLTIVILIASPLPAGEPGRDVQETATPAPVSDTGDSAPKDCGPQCLRYLSRYYGRPVNLERARELCGFTEKSDSTSMLAVKRACEHIGVHCFGLTGRLTVMQDALFSDCSFVVLTKKDDYAHFIVVVKGKTVNEWFWVDPSTQKGRQLLPVDFQNNTRYAILAVSDSPIQAVARTSQGRSGVLYRLLITPAVGALVTVLLLIVRHQKLAKRHCGARL